MTAETMVSPVRLQDEQAFLSCIVKLSSALSTGEKSPSSSWRYHQNRGPGCKGRTFDVSASKQIAISRGEPNGKAGHVFGRLERHPTSDSGDGATGFPLSMMVARCDFAARYRGKLVVHGAIQLTPASLNIQMFCRSRRTSHCSGMICQVRAMGGELDLQEPSSLADSPTLTVRVFLTSQHLLSITKKYMLMLPTCPLRNLPFPRVD